jgi:tRNA U34 5-carboxymethylaminomethyl modifying GTPase MnmE/TrmE
MGGSDSREVHHYHTNTVYQVPPETQAKLDEAITKVQALEEEAIAKEDPALFKENAAKAIDTFVRRIGDLDLKEAIDKRPNERHIAFIGNISAGKTSLINEMYGLDLPVALDHCTEGCKVVHTYKVGEITIFIWDVAGSNDDYKFYKAENLGFVKAVDLPVIVFGDDVAMITNFTKVVNAVNTNHIFVRTKCDMRTTRDARTIEQVRSSDLTKLTTLVPDPLLYCVSAHNVMNGREETFDWFALKARLN